MKRNILTYSAIFAFLAIATTSCQKDNATATSFSATMEQCQEQDGKTVFSNGIMQWESGDQIKVVGTGTGIYEAVTSGTGGTSFRLVSGDAGNAPYRAVYPASAFNEDGTVELPVVQVTTNGSLTGFPMYTESNGTALDFKNLCGILRLRLQKNGVSVTAIEITGDIELTGDFNVTYNGGTPTLAYSGHGSKTTMLTCSTPQSISSQKDFYIFLPDHTYTSMRIRIYNSDGGVCTKTLNANQSISIQRSKITTITMTNTNSLTFSPNAGALPGLFSIGESRQVRFSQGNLQFSSLGSHVVNTGSTAPGMWRFAPDQFSTTDMWTIEFGYSYSTIGGVNTTWIDNFWWGGSGYNSTQYLLDGVQYESMMTNGTYEIANTNYDWGVYNAILNGGNMPNMWRTLTKNEWEYLLMNRTDASQKWGIALVNDVPGLIILPDIWTLTELTFLPGWHGYTDDGFFDCPEYNNSQWKQMESHGAVFLPASGFGGIKSYHNPGYTQMITYWTSSADSEQIYGLVTGFNDPNFSTSSLIGRWWDPMSVRLVLDN